MEHTARATKTTSAAPRAAGLLVLVSVAALASSLPARGAEETTPPPVAGHAGAPQRPAFQDWDVDDPVYPEGSFRLFGQRYSLFAALTMTQLASDAGRRAYGTRGFDPDIDLYRPRPKGLALEPDLKWSSLSGEDDGVRIIAPTLGLGAAFVGPRSRFVPYAAVRIGPYFVSGRRLGGHTRWGVNAALGVETGRRLGLEARYDAFREVAGVKLSHLSVSLKFKVSPARSVRAATAPPRPLSPAQRGEVLDEVCRLVAERYYDPAFGGVDWSAACSSYRVRAAGAAGDAEFYAEVGRLVSELHDAHTRFSPPAAARRARVLDRARERVSAGVRLKEVEGVVAVADVDGPAKAAGLAPGMVVARVDGQPAGDRLADLRRSLGRLSTDWATRMIAEEYGLLAGDPGTPVTLGVVRADGSAFDVTLTRRRIPSAPPPTPRRLASGHGYLKLGTLEPPLHEQVEAALKRLAAAPGLILDLRGVPSGGFLALRPIAGYFFDEKVLLGRFSRRGGRGPSLIYRLAGIHKDISAGKAGGRLYSGPVVVLVDEATASGSELLAAALQESERAVVVGRRTCGCVLGGITHPVEGGGALSVSELDVVTAAGRRLEAVGVVPDREVPLTLADLRSGRDAALEHAVAVLDGRARGRAATSP